MSPRSLWPAEDHRNRRPRFPYRGAGPLLILGIVGLLVTTWSVLPPTERPPNRPDQPAEQPAPPLQPEPTPESEADEADACPEGCTAPKPGCDIKGNISVKKGERIYHLPGQRWYDKTVISPEKGERWFCTKEEAEANGWRRAKVLGAVTDHRIPLAGSRGRESPCHAR
jgi:hypothetical protein